MNFETVNFHRLNQHSFTPFGHRNDRTSTPGLTHSLSDRYTNWPLWTFTVSYLFNPIREVSRIDWPFDACTCPFWVLSGLLLLRLLLNFWTTWNLRKELYVCLTTSHLQNVWTPQTGVGGRFSNRVVISYVHFPTC